MPRTNSMLEMEKIKTSRMPGNIKKFRAGSWPPESKIHNGEHAKSIIGIDETINKYTRTKISKLEDKIKEKDHRIKGLVKTLKLIEEKTKVKSNKA